MANDKKTGKPVKLAAITVGKIRLLVKHGNGKAEVVMDEANVLSFTDSMVKDKNKTLRLKKSFALLGCRGDQLELQYYNATEQIDVSGQGDGFLESKDISNVSEALQLSSINGFAQLSPFGGIRKAASEEEVIAAIVEANDFLMMGDPDSRQTDATADTTVSVWSTFSTIKPTTANVLVFLAGTYWEFDKSSFTELA